MKTYAFDVTLRTVVRVEAASKGKAMKLINEALDCADANLGSWPNGDPILAEVSIHGKLFPIPEDE